MSNTKKIKKVGKLFRRKRSENEEKIVPSVKAWESTSTGSLTTSLQPEDQDPVQLFQDLKTILDQRRSDAIASINRAWDKVEESLIEEISLAREQSFCSLVEQLPSRVLEQEEEDDGVEVVLKQQHMPELRSPPSVSKPHHDFSDRIIEVDVSDMEQLSIITPTEQLARPTKSIERYHVDQSDQGELENFVAKTDQSELEREITLARRVTPSSIDERSDLDRYSVRSDYNGQNDENSIVMTMNKNIDIQADDAAFFSKKPKADDRPLHNDDKPKVWADPDPSCISSLGDTATIDGSEFSDDATDDATSIDDESLVSAFELMLLNMTCGNNDESEASNRKNRDAALKDWSPQGMVVVSSRCRADDISLIGDSTRACGPLL